jgi:hypothetical protein
MASGDRDGNGFIQVSELAAYVQGRVPGQTGQGPTTIVTGTVTARDSSTPSDGPGLEIPVIGARAKTVHSHYGSLPISSPICCVDLSPLPVKIITVVSADRMTPASSSLLSAAAPLAEVGST